MLVQQAVQLCLPLSPPATQARRRDRLRGRRRPHSSCAQLKARLQLQGSYPSGLRSGMGRSSGGGLLLCPQPAVAEEVRTWKGGCLRVHGFQAFQACFSKQEWVCQAAQLQRVDLPSPTLHLLKRKPLTAQHRPVWLAMQPAQHLPPAPALRPPARRARPITQQEGRKS